MVDTQGGGHSDTQWATRPGVGPGNFLLSGLSLPRLRDLPDPGGSQPLCPQPTPISCAVPATSAVTVGDRCQGQAQRRGEAPALVPLRCPRARLPSVPRPGPGTHRSGGHTAAGVQRSAHRSSDPADMGQLVQHSPSGTPPTSPEGRPPGQARAPQLPGAAPPTCMQVWGTQASSSRMSTKATAGSAVRSPWSRGGEGHRRWGQSRLPLSCCTGTRVCVVPMRPQAVQLVWPFALSTRQQWGWLRPGEGSATLPARCPQTWLTEAGGREVAWSSRWQTGGHVFPPWHRCTWNRAGLREKKKTRRRPREGAGWTAICQAVGAGR